MHTFCRWLLASCLIAAACAVHSAQPDPQALQPFLASLRQADLLRGSWAVSQGDSPPLSGHIGMATETAAAAAATRYRIGSVSKVFTAVLVLQLIEQGQLRLDQPVSEFFPNVPVLVGVTVEQLLGHRSGLGDVKDAPNFNEWARQPRSRAEMQALVFGLPRQSAPGARATYNNSGYLVLHWLVERAGGAPFSAQLRQRITQPLGLHSVALAQSDMENSRSFAWRSGAWLPHPATDPSVPGGAGAMVATPSDLTRFIRALFTHRLLQPASLARMTAQVDGFGLGLYALPQGGALALQGFGHEGQIDAFNSVMLYLPQQQVAVAVLTNGQHFPRDAVLSELIAWATQASYQPTDLRAQAQDWTLRVKPDGLDLPPGARVAVRGSQAPLSWQQGLPMQRQADGSHLLNLRWEGRTGLPLEAKFVLEDAQGQVLRWERTGNRIWLVGQPPGVMKFDVDADTQALEVAVLAADGRLSQAINGRDLAGLADLFSPRLTFFHDKGGVADQAANLAQFRQNFARTDRRTTRALIPESVQIHPVPGLGAMQIGRHRFCNVSTDAQAPQCQDLGFSHVWERGADGAWRLLTVLSYGH